VEVGFDVFPVPEEGIAGSNAGAEESKAESPPSKTPKTPRGKAMASLAGKQPPKPKVVLPASAASPRPPKSPPKVVLPAGAPPKRPPKSPPPVQADPSPSKNLRDQLRELV